jgi:hypothetical protein
MKQWIIAFMLLFPCLASAESTVTIAAASAPQTPAVKLQVRADYIAVPLTIKSNAKDPLKRTDETEKMYHIIADAVGHQPDMKLKTGVVSLASREARKFSGTDSSAVPFSTARLYLLASLKPGTSVYTATKKIYQVINSVHFEESDSVTLGNAELAMEDPEQYRSRLLGLISQSATEARKSLNTDVMPEVHGLENAVSVMQLSDTDVVLFINYTLTMIPVQTQ